MSNGAERGPEQESKIEQAGEQAVDKLAKIRKKIEEHHNSNSRLMLGQKSMDFVIRASQAFAATSILSTAIEYKEPGTAYIAAVVVVAAELVKVLENYKIIQRIQENIAAINRLLLAQIEKKE